jgi:hypothetical protein
LPCSLANLGIAVVKFAAFLLTGASSMLAEATTQSLIRATKRCWWSVVAAWPGRNLTRP